MPIYGSRWTNTYPNAEMRERKEAMKRTTLRVLAGVGSLLLVMLVLTATPALAGGSGSGSVYNEDNDTNDNNTLFSVQPAVAADGTLSYALAANANGSANVTIKTQDNGGIANGGVDASASPIASLT